jgi:glycolate oxidase FAD binding subunit
MSAIAQKLESIVGADQVTAWGSLDETMRNRIQPALSTSVQPDCVVYPGSLEELAEVVTLAHHHHWPILPCGSGSKLKWGGLCGDSQIILSTARLNRLVEHAVGDMTITAEAGLKVAELQATLAQAGQFLAIDPAYPDTATLGGIVATADAGFLRQRYGGVRDMLIGISFVRADGQIAKAGGRVVKNVAGYDLMKLMTGSWGTLSLIHQITFRVYPLPPASQTVVLLGSADALAQATQTLLASALAPTAVELLSPHLVDILGLGKGMGLMARFQSIPVSVKTQADHLLQLGQAVGLSGTLIPETDQHSLWQTLREQIDGQKGEGAIACKFGVLPSKIVATLDQLNTLLPQALSLIHAGSGLGILRVSPDAVQPQTLLTLRQLCQQHDGFLTVLEAPTSFKEKMDVWGYTGNALAIMQGLKNQFDPTHLLSPHRFIRGI